MIHSSSDTTTSTTTIFFTTTTHHCTHCILDLVSLYKRRVLCCPYFPCFIPYRDSYFQHLSYQLLIVKLLSENRPSDHGHTSTPSRIEFQPQCVKNPSMEGCSSHNTCGAHPLIISPLSFLVILSSNSSSCDHRDSCCWLSSFSSSLSRIFPTTQINGWPDASSALAISVS
ncbi:hypothetical protein Ddye_026057 [Dipteronia dyeriana]|uniref:Uncharacterized protein n=1 Tax=Dipteronia dyeriana TaxID=168575 RepID=A0AAD9TM15_9ROSI|nr:hypothetical protein Ddye_026057 [Dipteronia dyeriana]